MASPSSIADRQHFNQLTNDELIQVNNYNMDMFNILKEFKFQPFPKPSIDESDLHKFNAKVIVNYVFLHERQQDFPENLRIMNNLVLINNFEDFPSVYLSAGESMNDHLRLEDDVNSLIITNTPNYKNSTLVYPNLAKEIGAFNILESFHIPAKIAYTIFDDNSFLNGINIGQHKFNRRSTKTVEISSCNQPYALISNINKFEDYDNSIATKCRFDQKTTLENIDGSAQLKNYMYNKSIKMQSLSSNFKMKETRLFSINENCNFD